MATFKLDGEEYEFVAAEQLTLGELADYEDETGHDFTQLSGLRAAIAAVYLSAKRGNPDMTLARARGISMAEIAEVMGVDDDPPVEAPAGTGTPSS